MGQASKILLIQSTDGRLGLKRNGSIQRKDSCEKLGGITKQTNKQNREDSLYLKKLERI